MEEVAAWKMVCPVCAKGDAPPSRLPQGSCGGDALKFCQLAHACNNPALLTSANISELIKELIQGCKHDNPYVRFHSVNAINDLAFISPDGLDSDETLRAIAANIGSPDLRFRNDVINCLINIVSPKEKTKMKVAAATQDPFRYGSPNKDDVNQATFEVLQSRNFWNQGVQHCLRGNEAHGVKLLHDAIMVDYKGPEFGLLPNKKRIEDVVIQSVHKVLQSDPNSKEGHIVKIYILGAASSVPTSDCQSSISAALKIFPKNPDFLALRCVYGNQTSVKSIADATMAIENAGKSNLNAERVCRYIRCLSNARLLRYTDAIIDSDWYVGKVPPDDKYLSQTSYLGCMCALVVGDEKKAEKFYKTAVDAEAIREKIWGELFCHEKIICRLVHDLGNSKKILSYSHPLFSEQVTNSYFQAIRAQVESQGEKFGVEIRGMEPGTNSQKIENPEDPSTFCGFCGSSENLKRCARCKKVYYCSAECQKKHWKIHKVACDQ